MLKEIREHYGIPQSLFADYLGLTRSHLSMAESGRRNLSAAITLRILPLYLAISQPAPNKKEEALGKELRLQKKALEKAIDRRKKENEYKLPLLEKQLAKMKKDQSRSMQILEQVQSLRAAAAAADKGILTIIEMNARKLQKKTAEDAQLKLEIQLEQLQAEISYLKRRRK